MTLKMLIYDCSNKVRQELASLNQHQHHLVVIQLKVCNAVKMTNNNNNNNNTVGRLRCPS